MAKTAKIANTNTKTEQKVSFAALEKTQEQMLKELVLLKDAVRKAVEARSAPVAPVEADTQALRLLKRKLRRATARQVAAATVTAKARIALEMAAIVDQLPEGWQTRALYSEVKETLKELADAQVDAKTVKSKIRMGLKMAALVRETMAA